MTTPRDTTADAQPRFRLERGWVVHVVIFFAVVAGFLAISTAIYLTRSDFRGERAFRFDAMGNDDLLMGFTLTRRQYGTLQLGYVEVAPPPRVGIFGNHQVQHFPAEALGWRATDRQYFNYWFENLALPDLRDYLHYLAAIDRLPRELVMVGITSPNNDNGLHIASPSRELPTYIKIWNLTHREGTFAQRALEFARWAKELASGIHDYQVILTAIMGGAHLKVINPKRDCETSVPRPAGVVVRWLRGLLPETLLRQFGLIDASHYCRMDTRSFGMRADGSVVRRHDYRLTLNDVPFNPERRGLAAGDDERIASLLVDIFDLIETRNNRQLVFLIPPCYETADRHDSIVNQIFSKGVALAKAARPGLKVIDHRHLNASHLGERFFYEFDHPAPEYFAEVVAPELRRLVRTP